MGKYVPNYKPEKFSSKHRGIAFLGLRPLLSFLGPSTYRSGLAFITGLTFALYMRIRLVCRHFASPSDGPSFQYRRYTSQEVSINLLRCHISVAAGAGKTRRPQLHHITHISRFYPAAAAAAPNRTGCYIPCDDDEPLLWS